jgi:uncharacterized membrane protein
MIQFSALALPAIAIYMQILQKEHTDYVGGKENDKKYEYVDYHLTRASVFFILVGLVLLLAVLLALQPPVLIGGELSQKLIFAAVYLGISTIGLGLLFLGWSVFVRAETVDAGQQNVMGATIEAVNYTRIVKSHKAYRLREFFSGDD